jgi:hypothetical protein
MNDGNVWEGYGDSFDYAATIACISFNAPMSAVKSVEIINKIRNESWV